MSKNRSWRGQVGASLQEMPLRLRLVAVTVGLLVTALSLAGLAVSFKLEDFVVAQKSTELQQTAGQVHEQVTQNLDDVPAASTTRPYGTYMVSFLIDGEPPSHGDPREPDLPTIEPNDDLVAGNQSFIVPSLDGESRWVVKALPGPTSTSTMAVAAPLANADDTVTQMRWWIVAISLIAAITTGLLGWFLIRRAFRPLDQIEDTAQAIAAGDLTRRVPSGDAGDEVSSLASSLNVMLGRIEQAFAVRTASEDRMRRFVADASHELRTPLATVRGYAELYRQGAVTAPDEVSSSMLRIEDEAVRMSAMVDNLLLLTRLDSSDAPSTPSPPTAPEPVDLTVLAAEAVQDAGARDPDREIRLAGWSGRVGPAAVVGDDAQLRQVLNNLLTNAMRYTPAGTPIEVLTGRDDFSVVLAVRDHGPGIPADQRHRVFERFYRGEASRNTELGGSGLGLAIVQAIVSSHRGDVTVEPTAGGGATFIVRFAQQPHSIAPEDGQADGTQ